MMTVSARTASMLLFSSQAVFTTDFWSWFFIFWTAGGATLIFDTELVAVNGEPASKSDEGDAGSEL